MAKFVIVFALLSVFGASLAIDDAPLLSLAGGLSDLGAEGINNVLPTAHSAFSLLHTKYPEFDYILKRVVSGKSQVVAGSRAVLQVEVGPKDHADQTKQCELDLTENLQKEIVIIRMKCDGKDFEYYKE